MSNFIDVSLQRDYKMHLLILFHLISTGNLGAAFTELGKEKSSQKNAENHTQQFLKSLASVEAKLSEQINYLTQVSTGQPHEGSGYASAKVLQMAWHRIQHARVRIRELEDSKTKYIQAAARHQNRTNGSGGAATPTATNDQGSGGGGGAPS